MAKYPLLFNKEFNKPCVTCSKPIPHHKKEGRTYYWERKKYCSKQCNVTLGFKSGERNPRWNGGMRAWEKNIPDCKLCPNKLSRNNSKTGICFNCLKGPLKTGYKGRPHSQRDIEQKSLKYKNWRWTVFHRDLFTCQSCGEKAGHHLTAHHIKFWHKYPKLRYDVDNGVTLCQDCHLEIHRILRYNPDNWEATMDWHKEVNNDGKVSTT